MQNYLIRNISIVNEGSIKTGDVLIRNGRIEKIGSLLDTGMQRLKRSMERANTFSPVLSMTRFIFANPA